jgi:transcription initiation factor TFIIIB Brf1 subunit/transcription initiation factor TFIIB
MNDQIVVDRVCAEAQLPTAVRDRAVAHLRLLAVKMRGASGAISKHAVACALAATQLGAPFDRKKLVNLSGVNEAAFQQAFASMQSLLRIRYDEWRIFRFFCFFSNSPSRWRTLAAISITFFLLCLDLILL